MNKFYFHTKQHRLIYLIWHYLLVKEIAILHLVNKQKYQTSKIEKSMSQSFCNLRDAIEDCPNLNTTDQTVSVK